MILKALSSTTNILGSHLQFYPSLDLASWLEFERLSSETFMTYWHPFTHSFYWDLHLLLCMCFSDILLNLTCSFETHWLFLLRIIIEPSDSEFPDDDYYNLLNFMMSSSFMRMSWTSDNDDDFSLTLGIFIMLSSFAILLRAFLLKGGVLLLLAGRSLFWLLSIMLWANLSFWLFSSIFCSSSICLSDFLEPSFPPFI